jgi:NRPS condensation-like uncharacterized protein
MPEKPVDPIKPWFDAMEDLGEYIGIRFGYLPLGSSEPEWIFLSHSEVDGIGGFAQLLRQRGAEAERLPQIRYPSNPSWKWFFKTLPKYMAQRHRLKWRPLKQGPAIDAAKQPPPSVSWHAFNEAETTRIRRACRNMGVTINSFLLKHLSKAIRPYLMDESASMPWMIPVNLRGKVTRATDTSNYSSYVSINISSFETVDCVHKSIYNALAKGEHWANWYAYTAGKVLSPKIKRNLLVTDKAMAQWNLGGFSNLGDWDPEKKFAPKGAWLFSPPVLRCQLVGAGCVTYQNQLSLTLQIHPDLTTNPEVAQAWVENWVKEIELDLSSVLSEGNAAN